MLSAIGLGSDYQVRSNSTVLAVLSAIGLGSDY